eukprot:CAMPEP_0183361786 /NCGR_PEP_ID=MMETSP0164_2-20130417/64010_1 /TAXON_ID=221442 /ORGANISM="Coccolithus pelagicus ssp braarudi, Strain PLY182g" /LENGTH=35 /DNA_ID= /DNA_START= /DNA_END= /DNA_ORIENTATION=
MFEVEISKATQARETAGKGNDADSGDDAVNDAHAP